MDKNKIVIIVLIIVAVVFALGTGAGVFRDDSASGDSIEKWQERLTKLSNPLLATPLDIKDLRVTSAASDCQLRVVGETGNLNITEGKECVASIGAGKKGTRTAKLSLAEGVSAKIGFQPNPDSEDNEPRPMPATEILKNKQSVEISVFKEGGTLRVTCVQGTGQARRCWVRVE